MKRLEPKPEPDKLMPHIVWSRMMEDGFEILMFVPFAASSSTPAQSTPPPAPAPNPVRQEEEPPRFGVGVVDPECVVDDPGDAVEHAKQLLRDSGLLDGTVDESDPDEQPHSITDLLDGIRAAGKYLTLCQRAARELKISNVGGNLTEREEASLRSLCRELIGGS